MLARLLALTALLVLAGCAGMSYAIQNYGDVKVQRYTASSGAIFRVYDKPSENRLMITPSLASSFGGGLVKGATFGAMNPSSAEAVYRDAAEEYLASTGRSCRALDIALVVDPQYEIRYACEASHSDHKTGDT